MRAIKNYTDYIVCDWCGLFLELIIMGSFIFGLLLDVVGEHKVDSGELVGVCCVLTRFKTSSMISYVCVSHHSWVAHSLVC